MLSELQVNELNNLFSEELYDFGSYNQTNHFNSPISQTIIGGYTFIPLVTPRMIKSEAYLMRNCAKDYIGECALGRYCIYSVRDSDNNRIATLGIVNKYGAWIFDQCTGEDNSVVLYDDCVYMTDTDGDECEFYNIENELFYVVSDFIRIINQPDN